MWISKKNKRRCDLIDKEVNGDISPIEAIELEYLQNEMLEHRRKTFPLPIKEAQELLKVLRKATIGDKTDE